MLVMSIFVSCQEQYDISSPDSKYASQTGDSDDEVFSYENIIERANRYFLQLPEGTRSGAPEVKEVVPITRSSTRGDEIHPSYYLVNYDDNAGFAIMGANAVSDDMLAISNEGNLNLADTVFNKGLAAFLRAANQPSGIIVPPIEKDTTALKWPKIIVNVSIAPLLHTNVRMWGQGKPFNSYTPMVSKDGVTKHAPVGCVPLATAMMMSYYEWPAMHNGRNYDWKEIKNSMGTDALYYLLKELGNPENLNVSYKFDGSGSHISLCFRTFENYDYWVIRKYITLDQIDLSFYDTVKYKLPLLMQGYGIYDGENIGHAWVIDGLLHLPKYNAFEQIRDEDKYYFHCVWGWYGNGNGYFAYDKLKGIGGVRDRDCHDDGLYPGHSDSSNNPVFDSSYGIYSISRAK